MPVAAPHNIRITLNKNYTLRSTIHRYVAARAAFISKASIEEARDDAYHRSKNASRAMPKTAPRHIRAVLMALADICRHADENTPGAPTVMIHKV